MKKEYPLLQQGEQTGSSTLPIFLISLNCRIIIIKITLLFCLLSTWLFLAYFSFFPPSVICTQPRNWLLPGLRVPLPCTSTRNKFLFIRLSLHDLLFLVLGKVSKTSAQSMIRGHSGNAPWLTASNLFRPRIFCARHFWSAKWLEGKAAM